MIGVAVEYLAVIIGKRLVDSAIAVLVCLLLLQVGLFIDCRLD